MKAILIGCGAWAQRALVPTAKSLGVEFVGLFDPIKANREAVKEIIGNNVRYEGDYFTDVSDDIPIAFVATSASTQAGIAQQCLDRGFSVYCEKPLSSTEVRKGDYMKLWYYHPEIDIDVPCGQVLQVGYEYAYYEPLVGFVRRNWHKIKEFRADWQNNGVPRSDVGGLLNVLVHPASIIARAISQPFYAKVDGDEEIASEILVNDSGGVVYSVVEVMPSGCLCETDLGHKTFLKHKEIFSWTEVDAPVVSNVKMAQFAYTPDEQPGVACVSGVIKGFGGNVFYRLDTSWHARRKVRQLDIIMDDCQVIYCDLSKTVKTCERPSQSVIRSLRDVPQSVQQSIAYFLESVESGRCNEPGFSKLVHKILGLGQV